jgi:hypothetical protein
VTGRTLFHLGIAGSNYFGFNGDGIQLDLPITPLAVVTAARLTSSSIWSA